MIAIRRGAASDATAFLALFFDFYERSVYRTTIVSPAYAAREFVRATSDPSSLVLVAVLAADPRSVVGVLVATAGRNMFGAPGVCDLFTYALPGSGATPHLIRRYLAMAPVSEYGIVGIQTSSGPNPRYERLLERLGLVPIGVTYAHRDTPVAQQVLSLS